MRSLILLLVMSAFAATASAAAGAWKPVSTLTVRNTMHPAVLRTSSGTELVAFSDDTSTLEVWSSSTGDHTVASGLLSVGRPALVQLPSGGIELYAPATTPGFALQGVLRWESTNQGASWSGPAATHSPNLGDVNSAAVRTDGTPMFTQDSTFGVDVYQGLGGEISHRVFSACCGYAESVAVDTDNYAQLAFWSNANAFPSQFVYEGLDGTGGQAGPGRAFGQPQTAPRDDDVPLVADGAGNTFMGWAGGYPTATSFVVNTFRAGNLVYSTIAGGGTFSGGDPHMAIAVDPANRVWAVWTQNGAVHARRSRSAGRNFGAPTTGALGTSTAYQLAAVALADGRVDAIVDTGTALVHTTLLPGLTIAKPKTTVSVLDDGVGVKATLKGGGKTVVTGVKGTAKLSAFKRGVHVTVTAPGYAPASFTR